MDNTLAQCTATVLTGLMARPQFTLETLEYEIKAAKVIATKIIDECAPPIVIPEGAKKPSTKILKKYGRKK